jgi:Catalytic LigB subunit of aromatic ring-opening dioxygenase
MATLHAIVQAAPPVFKEHTMAEILGLGLSHYPPLCLPDTEMSGILRWTLKDPGIPEAKKDPANWPAAMRAEWSDDLGTRAAAQHRKNMVAGFDRVRTALDDFKPDVVLIWGDDQYENFREDIIPPFAVCAYGDLDLRPWSHAQASSMMKGKANAWGEDESLHYRLKGRPDIAKHLVTGLMDEGIDIAYAYKPLHHSSVAHAFTNAILYLDYHRKGYEHPTICFPVNCYGRRVISAKGFLTKINDPIDFDPPSPSPKRFMEVGAATARVLRKSPWRVAMIASSSWSHAFLVDKTWRLQPDTPTDRRLYQAMQENDFAYWRSRPLAEIEDAGQQEVLNWFVLAGAMEALGTKLEWSSMTETHIFNSNKVFGAYKVA